MREIYWAHQHNGRRDAQDITVIPYFRADSGTRFASPRLSHRIPAARASNKRITIPRSVAWLRSLKSVDYRAVCSSWKIIDSPIDCTVEGKNTVSRRRVRATVVKFSKVFSAVHARTAFTRTIRANVPIKRINICRIRAPTRTHATVCRRLPSCSPDTRRAPVFRHQRDLPSSW